MPIKGANILTVSHIFHDPQNEATKHPENDLDKSPELFKAGPDLNARVELTKGQIIIEIPKLRRSCNEDDLISEDDPEGKETLYPDEDYEACPFIYVVVDYFGDKLRIYYTDEKSIYKHPYDTTNQIELVESVTHLLDNNDNDSINHNNVPKK